MPPHPRPVSRRTTVGATALGLLAVSGCDLDDLDPRSDPSSPTAPETSAPPEDADTTLVAATVADITAMMGQIGAARGAVRRAFRPLGRLHRAHLTLLDATPDEATAPTTTPTSTTLTRLEERLQRRLATSAVAAESGELARVLAAMSAAVAQQLAVLPAAGSDR